MNQRSQTGQDGAENQPRGAVNRDDARWRAVREAVRLVRDVAGAGVRCYVFGSLARGEAGPASDIDLALEADGPLPRRVLAEIRERLEESHIPYVFDVVDLRAVDGSFANRIRQEAVLWTESGKP
ncbi:hypothetical protein GCM10010885_15190 [Alicyclobacillus cellulosilyticus]|uniref:Polymerase beta nucleotidyltransferase domain-containing protein n=1 Tax=Alicyclobacillus cellulosilyticus TaxID=1003997 RepID=A0A917NLM2_9BACL|nr:nucleotidyltransferase domain-containing protein [Alicyclobacillus cellulosilyticus]GGJ06995.1 hypothetical protein GCM10010885_15190 [Alicyclobacillus cellulosilyticus]